MNDECIGCGSLKGKPHLEYCDIEICAVCGKQMVCCICEATEVCMPENKSRKCIRCGCWHNMCVTAGEIEKIIEELQLCKDCIFEGCRFEPYKEHIIIDERADRVHTKHGASLIKISLDDKDEGKR